MVLRCFLPSRAKQSHNTWTTTRVSAQPGQYHIDDTATPARDTLRNLSNTSQPNDDTTPACDFDANVPSAFQPNTTPPT
jgi:hypothetical protein